MNVIFILIAVSLLVAVGFLISFIWSIRTGQYDDDYTPSVRILFDDDTNVIEEEQKNSDQKAIEDIEHRPLNADQKPENQ